MEEKDLINIAPLEKDMQKATDELVTETDPVVIKDKIELFNLYQTKKNVIRALKYNELLDKVSDEMLSRFKENPDEFTNSDLLNYLQTAQNALDRSNKALNSIEDRPLININQVNVNTEDTALNRESREKVMKAVQALLDKSKEVEEDTVEATIVEDKEKKEDDE